MSYSIDHALARLKQHHGTIRARRGWDDRRQPGAPVDAADFVRDLQRSVSYAELTLSNTPSTHPKYRELILLVELAKGELKHHATATRRR